MKGKEIMVVAIIIIILLVVIIVGTNMNKENEEVNNIGTENVENMNQNENQEIEELGEFETKTEDGTKVNTSTELSKTKTIDGLEISNIRLTEKENLSELIADVKNPTNGTLGDFGINITLVDKEGKEIITIGGYIDKVEPGETVELNSAVTADIANAYDFRISK